MAAAAALAVESSRVESSRVESIAATESQASGTRDSQSAVSGSCKGYHSRYAELHTAHLAPAMKQRFEDRID